MFKLRTFRGPPCVCEMSQSIKDQYASSALYGSNAAAVEALYEQYLENPDGVAEGWRRYFRSLGDGRAADEIAHTPIRRKLLESASRNGARVASVSPARAKSAVASGEKQAAVSRLIQVFSLRGHQVADLDPLQLILVGA